MYKIVGQFIKLGFYIEKHYFANQNFKNVIKLSIKMIDFERMLKAYLLERIKTINQKKY